MTVRQLLRRLLGDVQDALPPEASADEAQRVARLLLRRYGLARLLDRAVLAEVTQEVAGLTTRLSSVADQQRFRAIATLSAGAASQIAGQTEERLLREIRRSYAQPGGPSRTDLEGRLRKLIRHPRAQAASLASTSAAAYDRAARLHDAEAAGVERFRYAGPPADRPFCMMRLKEAREGVTYTLDEIRRMSNGQGLPVELYCGGYNCRHQWLPVFEEARHNRGQQTSTPIMISSRPDSMPRLTDTPVGQLLAYYEALEAHRSWHEYERLPTPAGVLWRHPDTKRTLQEDHVERLLAAQGGTVVSLDQDIPLPTTVRPPDAEVDGRIAQLKYRERGVSERPTEEVRRNIRDARKTAPHLIYVLHPEAKVDIEVVKRQIKFVFGLDELLRSVRVYRDDGNALTLLLEMVR